MPLPRLFWQLLLALPLICTLVLLGNECALAWPSRRIKNIAYVSPTAKDFDTERHRLDVFSPNHAATKRQPVVVFIHGGSWNSGSKNLYAFIGRRLAKKGVVAVIINYRLAPAVEVPDMARDCARSVQWVTQHIGEYGGDPDRIFVMGHSAGGGLAGLLATDDALFTKLGMAKNPIKGAILDDPAGLDMFDYLTKMQYPNDEQYLVPFGKDPAVWRSVSALYYVRPTTPPMLVYVGGRTYPGIASSTRRFVQAMEQAGAKVTFTEFPDKKHIPMVTQLFWGSNRIYTDLLRFVGIN